MAKVAWSRLPPRLATPARDAVVIEESLAARPPRNAKPIPKPEGLEDDYLPYQKAGIRYASERNTLIGDEMGLGKTVQALGTVNNLDSDRVLIIAPPSLLVNWKKEADKWVEGNPPIHIVQSGKAGEWKMPETGPGITIIGYSNLAKHRQSLRNSDWDMVILDEAHYIGNPESQRTQEVVGCVADACATPDAPPHGTRPIDGDRKLLLTGTPFDAKVLQMWPLVSYLAPEVWGETADSRKREEFQALFWDSANKRGKNLKELQKALRGSVMLRRTGDDVVDQVPLGPIQRRTIILEPGSEEERLAVRRSGEVNLGPMDADIHRPEKNPAFSEISKILSETAIAKAPQVGAYVTDAAREEPIVFFAYHKPLLHSVSRQLQRAGIKHDVIDGDVPPAERAKAVQRFQEGRTQAILLSQGTGKEGFTLTRSRRAIFGDLSWRPTDLLQAEKRIHRIGQKGDVLVEYMVLNDSLDAMQADVMQRKMASIAGGISVSESAASFGGVDDGAIDIPETAGDHSPVARAEFCASTEPTPKARQQVTRWARRDMRLATERLRRAASAAGLPDPTRPAMMKALAETERVAIDNAGKPVLLLDEDADVTPRDLFATPATPTPTPEPELATHVVTAPEPEPQPPAVPNIAPPDFDAAPAPPEPPPAVTETPAPKTDSPFTTASIDLNDEVIPLKTTSAWRKLDMSEKERAVARFNRALEEYQQAASMVDAIETADSPDDAIAVYCAFVNSLVGSETADSPAPTANSAVAPVPVAPAPNPTMPRDVIVPEPITIRASNSQPLADTVRQRNDDRQRYARIANDNDASGRKNRRRQHSDPFARPGDIPRWGRRR